MNEVDAKSKKTAAEGAAERLSAWDSAQQSGAPSGYGPALGESSLRSFRDEAEIHAISRALHQTGWNRKRAAQLLSISYRGLLYKIRRHNITPNNGAGLKPTAGGGEVQS